MRNRSRYPIPCALLTALALCAAGPRARAGMSGEQVLSGDATFQQQGNVTTIHASDGAILQYDQLSVWANEELHFVQPDSSSRVLNRVLGDATHIDGGLFANGIVYIVNPAGIFFGGSAVVDVAGLVAAAGSISNEDFLAGSDLFTLSGPVVNAGRIESPALALLGTEVANYGTLHAPDGTIALVAGDKVVLTQLGAHLAVTVEGAAGGGAERAAIEQAGRVDAGAGAVSFTTGDVASLAINHEGITRGGEIALRAASGTVQVTGQLDASDRSAGGVGGAIAVVGERVALLGAELDASGDAGGGSIRVGGDLRGGGDLPTARRTYVDGESVLRADALASGDGGRVIVWSDEATAFHGDISARGGAASGDGGLAEISGASLWADGDVDLSAPRGANGTLLYDPKDIVVTGGPGDGGDDPDTNPGQVAGLSLGRILFDDPDELITPFAIFESELEGTAANIVLQATNSITSAGIFDGVVRIADGFSLTMATRNNATDDDGSAFTPGIDLASVDFQTNGRSISMATGGDADLAVGDLTTRSLDAAGGSGGAVTLTAGGDLTLGGVIDARESATSTAAFDGGAVQLTAGGDIEHVGQPGPQIQTGGNVFLTAAGDIGAQQELQIEGGGEEGDQLVLRAGGTADVNVTNAGFLGFLAAVATDPDADIEITQSGGDAIAMAGAGGSMVVSDADGTGNDVNIEVAFENPDDDAADGALVLETGSVRSGSSFRGRSDGDIVIGTGDGVVIDATQGVDDFVTLSADDDGDGTGAVRDVAGGNTGVIDLNGGRLTVLAAEGVGAAGAPIVTSGGGSLLALNSPLKEVGGANVPDPDADTGIHLRNTVDGDLTIAASSEATGVQIDAGSGDIEIANDAGGIAVRSALRSKPLPNQQTQASNGTGGDVTLRVASGTRITLDRQRFTNAVVFASGGSYTYDGDVVLARNTEIEADGGVEILGALDASDTVTSPVEFTATLGDEATDATELAVQDGVGVQRALGSFTLNAPAGASLVLDTATVATSGGQAYGADLALVQTTSLVAGGAIDFAGDVTSPAALTVGAPAQIRFSGAGDQSVTTAGDLLLNPAGRSLVPADATISKASGNLSLASSGGDVRIGDGEKLSVVGQLALAGDTVRFTDLSALDIQVTSPDAQVFARAPGGVLTPDGRVLTDRGTDLVARTASFSSAPVIVGNGPKPAMATESGAATNAGPLSVAALPRPIANADFFRGTLVLDLAIPTTDPGHETPELWGGAIEPLLPPAFSDDSAAPAAPVSAEEVATYLACAPLAGEAAPAGCASADVPAYGSALDTERAQEVARGYRTLLDDSARSRAGRDALAHAAADPNTSLAHATSPGGRAYLADVARVLAQARLMGLGPAPYAEVKADVLEAVAAAIGLPDTTRLAAAVDASRMGMPI